MSPKRSKHTRGPKRVKRRPKKPTEPELYREAEERHADASKTRPVVDYSFDLSEHICERLANGETGTAICRGEGMPTWGAMQRWIRDKPDFARRFRLAREAGYEYWADDTVDIADNTQAGEIRTTQEWGTQVRVADMLEHRRLRIDARKWLLCKRARHIYGERVETAVTGPDGGPLQIEERNALIEAIVQLVHPKPDGKTKPDKDGSERDR